VLDLLDAIRERRGMTVLIVSHNDEVARRADRVVRLIDGLVRQ
jgi:ABC-type lipoprotein export system ATPase subunit